MPQFLYPFLFLLILLQTIPLTSASDHFQAVSTNNFLAKTTDLQTVSESSSSGDSAISGPVFGSLFFIFSLILLWYNEKGYVTTCHRLKEELLECADLDPYNISTENNGHLVYLKSSTSCDDILKDNQFPAVESFNAIKLLRTVEKYQWKEERHEDKDHHVHYDYTEIWDEKPHDSAAFHESGRVNTGRFFCLSEKFVAKEVHIGCYKLSEELKEMAKNITTIIPTEEIIRSAAGHIQLMAKEAGKEFIIQDDYIYICQGTCRILNGDLRIKFSEIKCGPTTIVGQLEDNSFIHHQIESAVREDRLAGYSNDICDDRRGWCNNCCFMLCRLASQMTTPIKEILWLFEKDIATKEDVFEEVTKEHQKMRNIIRGVGWVLSWVGIWIFFGPIVYLLSIFPLIGGLLSTLASWAALLFGLIVGTVTSVMVICIAWLFYRPLISLGLILISVGLGVGLCYV